MADDVLPADEVAALTAEQVAGYRTDCTKRDIRPSAQVACAWIVTLCDSHEELRATVARLTTAARGVAAVSDNHAVHTGNCWACESASGHADWCPIATLRAALDATTAEPAICPGSGQERVSSPGGYDPPGPEGMCPVCEQIVAVDDGLIDDHPATTPAQAQGTTPSDATTAEEQCDGRHKGHSR